MVKPLLFSAALLIGSAEAACECGYKTNTGETWQYSIETDFSQLSTSQWLNSADWSIVETVHEATVDLNYTSNNVALSNGKLQLTCSAYNSSANDGILSGEITTTRQDIFRGSFRASYSVLSLSPGSVSGFFFYANDTQEIDIEVQTKMNNQTVHFANQPDENAYTYLPNNGVVGQIHNYRFDWLENETRFYLDSVPAGSFSEEVPVVNGTINLNMWGNGGPFSGPQTPTTDNVMSISNISLYFNSSSKSMSRKWEKACAAASNRTVCLVDTAGLAVNSTAADSDAGKSLRSRGSLTKSTWKKVLFLGLGTALYHI